MKKNDIHGKRQKTKKEHTLLPIGCLKGSLQINSLTIAITQSKSTNKKKP
jgi:hypothetical protein